MDRIDWLLAPTAAPRFFAEDWLRRPLFVAGDAAKAAALFDRDAFTRALAAAPACGVDVKAVTRSPDEPHREVLVGADDAAAAFADGATICATGIHRADEKLAAFIADVRRELMFPGDPSFNCYWSPDGHGFGTHFDNHSVFILQIAGAKRWRYSRKPAVEAPTLNAVVPRTGEPLVARAAERVARPDELDFAESVLAPGDVLYLPPGTWHRAAANGESLALTLTLPKYRVFDFFVHLVEARLLADAGWRRDVPVLRRATVSSGAETAELQSILLARLAEMRALLSQLTPTDLFDQWYRVLAPRVAPPATRPDGGEVRPEELLRRAPTTPLVHFIGDGAHAGVAVYHDGKRYPFPADVAPLFRALGALDLFVAGAATTWFDDEVTWTEVQPVLQFLVEIGLLEREPAP